jgi:hypothetical protein
MNTKYYWHIHHRVLFEQATEPIKNRIAYIKSDKPECEVALRLRLLKPVKDQKRLIAILTAYKKVEATAWEAYKKAKAPALEAYEKATATALAKRDKAINTLHAKECPNCPWDGMTIFPKRNGSA